MYTLVSRLNPQWRPEDNAGDMSRMWLRLSTLSQCVYPGIQMPTARLGYSWAHFNKKTTPLKAKLMHDAAFSDPSRARITWVRKHTIDHKALRGKQNTEFAVMQLLNCVLRKMCERNTFTVCHRDLEIGLECRGYWLNDASEFRGKKNAPRALI